MKWMNSFNAERERERFTSSPTFLCGNTPADSVNPLWEVAKQSISAQVLARFMSTPESSWEALVTSGRGSLSTDFFAHMENLVRASHDDNAKRDGKPPPQRYNVTTALHLLLVLHCWSGGGGLCK